MLAGVALFLAGISVLPASPPGCPTAHARASYLDGRKLLAAGEASGAVERLIAARAECPSPAVEFFLATAYERLGRLSLAIDALDKYLGAQAALDNRVAVRAWIDELRARADAERQGVPPPSLPSRAAPAAPPLYFPEEAATPLTPIRSVIVATPIDQAAAEPWLFFASAGLSINGSLQPGRLSGHDGTASRLGATYQIGLGYRVSMRARLHVMAMVSGQILPWTRSDVQGAHDALFATVIAVGLRADLPLFAGVRTHVLLSPSTVAGLGSISLDVDPSYENAVALRFGLALVVERGDVGLFIEPQSFLFTGGDLKGAQWTAGLDAGVRVRF